VVLEGRTISGSGRRNKSNRIFDFCVNRGWLVIHSSLADDIFFPHACNDVRKPWT
jgi:hypothetical protein